MGDNSRILLSDYCGTWQCLGLFLGRIGFQILMSNAKRLIRPLIPAALRRQLSECLGRSIHFQGGYQTWAHAAADSAGYGAEDILQKVLASTRQVMRGEASFERDSVAFHHAEVHWPTLAALLWSAARSRGHLSVLDLGGALGSSYFQHKSFLSHLASLDWKVVEQPHFVNAGRAHVDDGNIRFFHTVEECLLEQTPGLVLLSSVLQYLEHVDDVLQQIASTQAEVLCVARTPVAQAKENQVLVQHVPASICKSSYPMWVFSESWLLDRLSRRWRLVSCSESPEGHVRPRGGAEFIFKDMLFEKVGP